MKLISVCCGNRIVARAYLSLYALDYSNSHDNSIIMIMYTNVSIINIELIECLCTIPIETSFHYFDKLKHTVAYSQTLISHQQVHAIII